MDSEQPKREWKDLSQQEQIDFLMNAVGVLEKKLTYLAQDHIALKNGALAFVSKVAEVEGIRRHTEKDPIIIPVRGKFRGPRLSGYGW